jgi:hypothetical protein
MRVFVYLFIFHFLQAEEEWWQAGSGQSGPLAELLTFTNALETLREAYHAQQAKKPTANVSKVWFFFCFFFVLCLFVYLFIFVILYFYAICLFWCNIQHQVKPRSGSVTKKSGGKAIFDIGGAKLPPVCEKNLS